MTINSYVTICLANVFVFEKERCDISKPHTQADVGLFVLQVAFSCKFANYYRNLFYKLGPQLFPVLETQHVCSSKTSVGGETVGIK